MGLCQMKIYSVQRLYSLNKLGRLPLSYGSSGGFQVPWKEDQPWAGNHIQVTCTSTINTTTYYGRLISESI